MRDEETGPGPEEMQEMDEHFKNDTLEELVDFAQPVKVKPGKKAGARATVGLRLAPGEIALIEQAAKARGASFSEFLREAALAVASGSLSMDETVRLRLLSDMRIRLQEFEAALDRTMAPN